MSTSAMPNTVKPKAIRIELPPTICPQRAPSRNSRIKAIRFEHLTARSGFDTTR